MEIHTLPLMPLIPSPYTARGIFRNGHFSTIYSAKIRPLPQLVQHRKRLELTDGDFLDLDFSQATGPADRLAVLLHGLEGNAQRVYVQWQAKCLLEAGWDVCAVNYRGCSGEPNRRFESYNAGRTDDLDQIMRYLRSNYHYSSLGLIGFSLGGNLLLKYLGERSDSAKEVQAAVAISSPLDLKGSLLALSKPHNWVYRNSFLHDLRKKYRIKQRQFPDRIDSSDLRIRTLLEFDEKYTAPAHGFKDAYDYYRKSSSAQYLPEIKVPTLILNARNDSFLSPNCYPHELASQSKNIYLETPDHGGHVGFYRPGRWFYSERRAVDFMNEKT